MSKCVDVCIYICCSMSVCVFVCTPSPQITSSYGKELALHFYIHASVYSGNIYDRKRELVACPLGKKWWGERTLFLVVGIGVWGVFSHRAGVEIDKIGTQLRRKGRLECVELKYFYQTPTFINLRVNECLV